MNTEKQEKKKMVDFETTINVQVEVPENLNEEDLEDYVYEEGIIGILNRCEYVEIYEVR